jgi:hypothetical protein
MNVINAPSSVAVINVWVVYPAVRGALSYRCSGWMSGIRRPGPADRGGAQRSAGSGTSACSMSPKTH